MLLISLMLVACYLVGAILIDLNVLVTFHFFLFVHNDRYVAFRLDGHRLFLERHKIVAEKSLRHVRGRLLRITFTLDVDEPISSFPFHLVACHAILFDLLFSLLLLWLDQDPMRELL